MNSLNSFAQLLSQLLQPGAGTSHSSSSLCLVSDELCASLAVIAHPFSLRFLSSHQPLLSYCQLFLAPRVAGWGGTWKHGSVSGLWGRKVQAGVCVGGDEGGCGWCVYVCFVSITRHQNAFHETNSAVFSESWGIKLRPTDVSNFGTAFTVI